MRSFPLGKLNSKWLSVLIYVLRIFFRNPALIDNGPCLCKKGPGKGRIFGYVFLYMFPTVKIRSDFVTLK